MSAMDAASLPYLGMDIAEEQAKRLARLDPEGPALVRPFAPVVAGMPTFTPVEVTPLDVRERSAALTAPVPFAAPEADLELLRRTRDGLKRLPRSGELIFAGAVAEHYGTGPRAAAAPAEEPEPGGTVLRDLLADAFWLAAQWYADPDDGDVAKSRTYADLNDAVVGAPTDAAALDMVRTALAEGTAELGDSTFGSLEQIGGAE
jgi:hypothetical protein